jgi:hypothetical protein
MNIGDKYFFAGGYRLEIMAIAKGYVMARYKGAIPFVKSFSDMLEIIKDANATNIKEEPK